MRIESIDNHSVAVDLLPERASILDVGSRDYRFANALAEMGHQVLCLDPDPTVAEPIHKNVRLLRAALVAPSSPVHQKLVMTGDPEARYLISGDKHTQWPQKDIRTVTLSMLERRYWDLVKLNCEGEEYALLNELTEPIATQITCSFHEHGQYPRGREAVDSLVQRLGRWYKIVRHEWDHRYSAGMNAWDSLFVRE